MNGNFKKLLDAGDIVPALGPDGKPFELEGVAYYQYRDGGIPTRPLRFHAFAEVNFEHEAWQMDRDALLAFMVVFKDYVVGTLTHSQDPEWIQRNAPVILNTVTNVHERVQHYNSTIEFVYDVASVLYFHQDEDPMSYDIAEARRKKGVWRRYPELYDFFLSTDLGRHVPLARLSQPDTLISAAKAMGLMLTTLQSLSLEYDSGGMTSGTRSFIDSQTASLKEYATSLLYLLRSTSTTSPPTGGR